MKIVVRNFIRSLPFGKSLWLFLSLSKNILKTAKPFPNEEEEGFFGWDMYTLHCPPWMGKSKISKNFNLARNEFLELINSKNFIPSFYSPYQVNEQFLKGHMWRVYNIFWSVNFAINSTNSVQKNFIECGVCDGFSTYFALTSSVAENIQDQKFYLYDAWEESQRGMEEMAGLYALELENAKSNLKSFEDMTIFNKGILPKSFEFSINPMDLVWLHIDLPSSQPTLAALEYFYDKLAPGGVILLDHYGWNIHRDCKAVVDKFYLTKNGINFPLPTGQAIYFKLN